MFPIRDSVSRTHEPIVVWTIMGLNIAAFFYQLGLSEPELSYFLYQHALVPRRYFSPGWAHMYGLSPTDFSPFLSNIFLHGGWLHIILNMWTLYIFGPALEDRLGPVRFPYAWVRILVPIVFIPLFFSIPAIAFAGIWFFIQVLQGTSELMSPFQVGAGIAWWAHIGGFVAGWLLLGILDPTLSDGRRRPLWYNGGPWERS